jgi:hypothetical protein
MLHTTFRLAREAGACKDPYRKYAKHVGGVTKYGKDTPIKLIDILQVLGAEDTYWCFGCVLPEEEGVRNKLSRLLACDFAEHVLPIYERAYPNDKRPRQAIETSRRYTYGHATAEELVAALAAAWAAREAAGGGSWGGCLGGAAWAARAAYGAAGGGSWGGCLGAAWAAWAATRAAGDAAAWAAREAAREAEREWQLGCFARELMGEA